MFSGLRLRKKCFWKRLCCTNNLTISNSISKMGGNRDGTHIRKIRREDLAGSCRVQHKSSNQRDAKDGQKPAGSLGFLNGFDRGYGPGSKGTGYLYRFCRLSYFLRLTEQ